MLIWIVAMSELVAVINALSAIPQELLVLLLALGIVAFAGYCVHVIHSLYKRGGEK